MTDPRTIQEVFEYLLENDEPWVRDPKEPFLCIRIEHMARVGLIDWDLMRLSCRWIMRKIGPYAYLYRYHAKDQLGMNIVLAHHNEWPMIRRAYLKRWIAELKEPLRYHPEAPRSR